MIFVLYKNTQLQRYGSTKQSIHTVLESSDMLFTYQKLNSYAKLNIYSTVFGWRVNARMRSQVLP
jgi:hypothetical protein